MGTVFSAAWKNKLVDMMTWQAGYDPATVVPATFNLFTGDQPADTEAAEVTGNGNSAWGTSSGSGAMFEAVNYPAAVGGKVNMAEPYTSNVGGYTTSDFTWARIYAADGSTIMDVTPTTSLGGGALILDTLSITPSTAVMASAFNYEQPKMFGTLSISTALANKLVDDITGFSNASDAGYTILLVAASVKFYSGTPPATVEHGLLNDNVLLGSIASLDEAWDPAIDGVASLVGDMTITVVASGTVTFARVSTYLGENTIQLSVGTENADWLVDEATFTSGISRLLVSAPVGF